MVGGELQPTFRKGKECLKIIKVDTIAENNSDDCDKED